MIWVPSWVLAILQYLKYFVTTLYYVGHTCIPYRRHETHLPLFCGKLFKLLNVLLTLSASFEYLVYGSMAIILYIYIYRRPPALKGAIHHLLSQMLLCVLKSK